MEAGRAFKYFSGDSSGLGQAQRVFSPNCCAAGSWTTPEQRGRRLTAQQTHQSSRRYSIKRLSDLHLIIFYERNLFPSDEAHSNFIPPGEQCMSVCFLSPATGISRLLYPLATLPVNPFLCFPTMYHFKGCNTNCRFSGRKYGKYRSTKRKNS